MRSHYHLQSPMLRNVERTTKSWQCHESALSLLSNTFVLQPIIMVLCFHFKSDLCLCVCVCVCVRGGGVYGVWLCAMENKPTNGTSVDPTTQLSDNFSNDVVWVTAADILMLAWSMLDRETQQREPRTPYLYKYSLSHAHIHTHAHTHTHTHTHNKRGRKEVTYVVSSPKWSATKSKRRCSNKKYSALWRPVACNWGIKQWKPTHPLGLASPVVRHERMQTHDREHSSSQLQGVRAVHRLYNSQYAAKLSSVEGDWKRHASKRALSTVRQAAGHGRSSWLYMNKSVNGKEGGKLQVPLKTRKLSPCDEPKHTHNPPKPLPLSPFPVALTKEGEDKERGGMNLNHFNLINYVNYQPR